MKVNQTILSLPATDHGLAQIAGNVAASMPVAALAHAERHVTFVSGEADWDEAALQAAGEGAAGILLHCPGYLPASRISVLGDKLAARNVALVVRSLWSSHATIAKARQMFSEVQHPVLIDVVLRNNGSIAPAAAAIGAIQMVQALVGSVNRLAIDSTDSFGFSARGSVGEGGLALTLTAGPSCDGCSFEIRLLGMDSMAMVTADYSSAWQPVSAMFTDPNGPRWLPEDFESPDRTSYARLIRLIDAPAPDLTDLHSFAAAAALFGTTPLAA